MKAIFRRVDQWGNIGDAALSDRSVARIVKRSAALAGLDPAEFAGHSLRAGLATAAARSGAKLEAIKAQGRWRSLRTVDRYVREAEAFEDNVAEGLL